MDRKRTRERTFSWLTLLTLLVSLIGVGGTPVAAAPQVEAAEAVAAAPAAEIFHMVGTVLAGQNASQDYTTFNNLPVNIKIQVMNVTTTTVPLVFELSNNGTEVLFTDQALDGETLWATAVLKSGFNTFKVINNNSMAMSYEIWAYNIPSVDYSWNGVSLGAGSWRSHIQLDFPSSGLYQFNTGLVAGGRYQLVLDQNYLQKTVSATGVVTFYVASGRHDIFVIPDSKLGTTSWSLNVTGPGATEDSLPYSKLSVGLGGTGNDFTEEWLPLYLPADTETNLTLAVQGATQNAFDVHLLGATGLTPTQVITGVYGTETLWWSWNLTSGLNRLHLLASAANTATLNYTVTVYAKPTTVPVTWRGTSLGKSSNYSTLRFQVDTDGLYDFPYGVTAGGRFQFKVDSGPHIQKTVESAGTVRYYLGAGTHTLMVAQDPISTTTNWTVGISPTVLTTETLPITRTGGNLGGTNNAFTTEWLPIYVDGEMANFRLTLGGALTNGMRAYLYPASTATPVYTSPEVFGGETFWWPAPLASGLNYLKLEASNDNTQPLTYTLRVESIPEPSYTWAGLAKGTGGNSTVRVNIPTSGTYHMTMTNVSGFAQVVRDGVMLGQQRLAIPTLGHEAGFDVLLDAGPHEFMIRQTTVTTTTQWALTIVPTQASALLANFSGNLITNTSVSPQLPWVDAYRRVNLKMRVPEANGNGALTLTYSYQGAPVTRTIFDGETIWAMAEVTPGQNTLTVSNGISLNLSYELTLFDIPTTPSLITGTSKSFGQWDSNYLLNFPNTGLYDFSLGLTSGRYQLLLDGGYLQKVVQGTGATRFFVPAGTHAVQVLPDRTVGATWTLSISPTAVSTDSLPYTKTGGNLWGTAGVFGTERLPLLLGAGAETNFRLTLTGGNPANTDSLDVVVYACSYAGETWNCPTVLKTIDNVYGGESLWWTMDLPSDLVIVEFKADNANTSWLSYDLRIEAKGTAGSGAAALRWTGVSRGVGNQSQIRFNIPQDGLYDFTYSTVRGRFQVLVDPGPYLQKTVDVTSTTRYYLPAGQHILTITQSSVPTLTTQWALTLTQTSQAQDSLPYQKDGGNLGGVLGGFANPFTTEWLPIYITQTQPVNVRLTLTGYLTDGITATLYHGSITNPVHVAPFVYGGESTWWSTSLASGMNWIKLTTGAVNVQPLRYQLTVMPISTVGLNTPYLWSGVAKNTGAYSIVRVNLPVSGTYRLVMDNGYGASSITYFTTTKLLNSRQPIALGPHFEQDLQNIPAGPYLFRVQQQPAFITTTWAVTLSLKTAAAPTLSGVNPMTVSNLVTNMITLTGTDFLPGASVMVGMEAVSTTWVSGNELQIVLPLGFALGTYGVTVTNPDGQSAFMPDALNVVTYLSHAPVVTGVTPGIGRTDRQTPITITGQYFAATPIVRLGSQTLLSVTLVSDSMLTAVVPAGMAVGTYDLTVVNPDTQSGTLPGAFEIQLVLPPDVLSVTPGEGDNKVETPITITGLRFMATPEVRLDNQTLVTVTFVSSTTLLAVVPPGLNPGKYDLTVINPDLQQDTLVDAFEAKTGYKVYIPLAVRTAGP